MDGFDTVSQTVVLFRIGRLDTPSFHSLCDALEMMSPVVSASSILFSLLSIVYVLFHPDRHHISFSFLSFYHVPGKMTKSTNE